MVKKSFPSDNKKLPIFVFFFSVLIAFFCDIKSLNALLARNMDNESGESGPMALFYLASILGVGIVFSLSNKKLIKDISNYAIFLLIWFIAFYMLTLFMIAPPFTSIVFFSVFTLSSFMIPFIAVVDGKVMLKTIMLLVFPVIFYLNEVFAPTIWYQDFISMVISYSFLTPVVASIVYVSCYFGKERKLEKVITLLGFSANMIYAYYLISLGSRGPALAIFLTIVFLLFFKKNRFSLGIMPVKGTYIWMVMAAVILIFFFESILNMVHGFLKDAGMTFIFIDKFVSLTQEGDVTNGRDMVYSMALADILDKPLFGSGMDVFNHYHQGHSYPHNFLLQIFYDGGVLLFLILVVPLYRCIKRLWQSCTHDEYAVYTVLFFGSVPGALFSGDLWQNSMLWLFFGALLSNTFIYKKPVG